MKNIEQQIKGLEETLLRADVRKNPEILDELLGEDFEEIGSNGKVNPREEVIHWLLNKEQDVRWSLSEFRVRRLSADLVLATYRARQENVANETYQGSMRSSIWKRNGEQWQMIFHQGTRVLAQ